jgi:hypothetical protein
MLRLMIQKIIKNFIDLYNNNIIITIIIIIIRIFACQVKYIFIEKFYRRGL